ncbi:NUDIX hydrolase [Nocardioides insulae]|uniref:NUDIX hydrolase n=1 Tax=Nocardioides insulae TaxID=394734 RepID=UPI000421E1A2|nr:NUDIX hydrolase [Nocardioides insulae]
MPPGELAAVLAAGAVVLRKTEKHWQVLLVHRPRYDDWSFPKGKVDPGEHVTAAAVREVKEETGLDVRLMRRLGAQQYQVAKGAKRVDYWTARVVGNDDVESYRPNAEIDRVVWVQATEAHELLTYPHDRVTLDEALVRRRRTETVLVLRHSDALSRSEWSGPDAERPLLPAGQRQARALVPVLSAYGVRRVITSPSVRCADTVVPWAEANPGARDVEGASGLSEEEATGRGVAKLTRRVVDALDDHGPTVLCTHRPVLPLVFSALGVPDVRLRKGELVAVQLREGRVVDQDRHLAEG